MNTLHARTLRTLAGPLAIALSGICTSGLHSQNVRNPDLPTASEDPAVIDQQWKEASAKYDSQRQRILGYADRADADGSFRADWESLQKYEIPSSPVPTRLADGSLHHRIALQVKEVGSGVVISSPR